MAAGTSPAPSTQLSHTETYSLCGLTIACFAVLVRSFERGEGEPLIASLAFSGLAFAASYAMIRWLGPTFIKAGLHGRDMAKVNNHHLLPECMGAICAVVYLFAIIFFILIPFYKDIVVATSGGGNRDVVMNVEYVQTGRLLHRFPHSKVSPPGVSFPLPSVPSYRREAYMSRMTGAD
jgi:UDP-N-acetylglucosamine--dolichyl-phosphate N-acetylglucosaminephosphotransferase